MCTYTETNTITNTVKKRIKAVNKLTLMEKKTTHEPVKHKTQ